ncbi:MAG: hypothetical protein ABIK86_07480 [candidate division WOR-3 bacterium]
MTQNAKVAFWEMTRAAVAQAITVERLEDGTPYLKYHIPADEDMQKAIRSAMADVRPSGAILAMGERMFSAADLAAIRDIAHRHVVESACRAGKPVPEEVLASYRI